MTNQKRREIPDGRVPGLYHVHQPSGAKSWALRYRNSAGQSRKLTLDGGDLPRKEAQRVARVARVEIDKGADPASAKAKRPVANIEELDPETVGGMVELFFRKHVKVKQNARTQVETMALFRRFVLPRWRDRKLSEIRRRDVFDLMDHIIDSGAPTSANRTLSVLKVFYRWALN